MLGAVATWIAGPSKGLLATAEEGCIPPIFQKTNKKGIPVNVLIAQGIIVSIMCLVLNTNRKSLKACIMPATKLIR